MIHKLGPAVSLCANSQLHRYDRVSEPVDAIPQNTNDRCVKLRGEKDQALIVTTCGYRHPDLLQLVIEVEQVRGGITHAVDRMAGPRVRREIHGVGTPAARAHRTDAGHP